MLLHHAGVFILFACVHKAVEFKLCLNSNSFVLLGNRIEIGRKTNPTGPKIKPSPTATQPAGPFLSRPSLTPRSLSLPHRASFSRVAWPALPRAATLAPALFPAPHGPHPRPSSRRPAPAAPAPPHARRPLAALSGPHASVTPAQRRAPLTALAHPPAPSPPPLPAAQRPGTIPGPVISPAFLFGCARRDPRPCPS